MHVEKVVRIANMKNRSLKRRGYRDRFSDFKLTSGDPEHVEWAISRVQEISAILDLATYGFDSHVISLLQEYVEVLDYGPHELGPIFREKVRQITKAWNRSKTEAEDKCSRGIHTDGIKCFWCGEPKLKIVKEQ